MVNDYQRAAHHNGVGGAEQRLTSQQLRCHVSWALSVGVKEEHHGGADNRRRAGGDVPRASAVLQQGSRGDRAKEVFSSVGAS